MMVVLTCDVLWDGLPSTSRQTIVQCYESFDVRLPDYQHPDPAQGRHGGSACKLEPLACEHLGRRHDKLDVWCAWTLLSGIPAQITNQPRGVRMVTTSSYLHAVV